MSLVKEQVPDVSDEATAYLQEAVVAFYADCLLASCVMLGVAAEAEFLRLAEIAEKSANYGSTFAPVQSARFIRQKITKFQECLNTVVRSLPREAVEVECAPKVRRRNQGQFYTERRTAPDEEESSPESDI